MKVYMVKHQFDGMDYCYDTGYWDGEETVATFVNKEDAEDFVKNTIIRIFTLSNRILRSTTSVTAES